MKAAQKLWLLLQFSKNLPKVNNRPTGENLPSLVTLAVANPYVHRLMAGTPAWNAKPA
jgi:hypothetical protein